MPPLKVEGTMKEEIINFVSIGGPNIRGSSIMSLARRGLNSTLGKF